MEKGAEVMNKWFTEFIAEYAAIGGKLDGLVTDLEYFELSEYYINQQAQKDMFIYYKIVENPNYATKIRPELVERGFKFWPKVTDETPEIYSISSGAGAEYSHFTPNNNDLRIPVEVGYAFFVNKNITIEPAVYYKMSLADFSDNSTVGLKIGFGFYF
jgi:hypothetical protein